MDYLIYQISDLNQDLADMDTLSAEERVLAERRGAQYALIRTILRQEIARRAQVSPGEVEFTYGPNGKPECALQPFNLSHSGDCLCLAFHHKSIGVDVERMRPKRFEALAGRFMTPLQLQGFRERGSTQDEFFACWCAAEALVKHAGDTMWNAKSYPFLYRKGNIECLFEHAPVLQLFTPMPGYCGAVAYTPS